MKKTLLIVFAISLILSGCAYPNAGITPTGTAVVSNRTPYLHGKFTAPPATPTPTSTPKPSPTPTPTPTPTPSPKPTRTPTPAPTPTLSPEDYYSCRPESQWRVFTTDWIYYVGTEDRIKNYFDSYSVRMPPGDNRLTYEINKISIIYADKDIDITNKIWSEPDGQIFEFGLPNQEAKSNIIQIRKEDNVKYIEIIVLTPLYDFYTANYDLEGFALLHYNYLTNSSVESELSLKYLFKGEILPEDYQVLNKYGQTMKIVYKIPVDDIFDLMEKIGVDKYCGIDIYKYVIRYEKSASAGSNYRGEFARVCSLFYLQFLG